MPRSKLAVVLRVVFVESAVLVAVVVGSMVVESLGPFGDPFGDTPEGALRSLLLAISTRDAETMRKFALPNRGLDLLLEGDADLGKSPAELRRTYARQSIRRLKAGDPVRLPGGKVVVVKPEEVQDGCAVVWPEGFPVPFRCFRFGHWRVDASSLVAARRAVLKRKKKGAQAARAPS